jgi:hypothetical protein
MLSDIKAKAAAARLFDEQLHAQVIREIEAGQRRDGIWAKALSDSNGSENETKALYIKYRVQSIRDELAIANNASAANGQTNDLPKIVFNSNIPASEKMGHVAAHFVRNWIIYSIIFLILLAAS